MDESTPDADHVWRARAAACIAGLIASGANHAGDAGPGLIGGYVGPATEATTDTFDLFVSDVYSYDDNLFKLPDDYQALGFSSVRSKTDRFNTASAGADGEYLFGLQDLQFGVHLDDNVFDRNSDLNNVSGGARGVWNWRVGRSFLGDVGVDYTRHLAGFAATGYLGRDIVTREDYFGDMRWQLGPRWSVFGGVMGANTSNSAAAEDVNNARSKSASAGAEVATSVNNAVGVEYRFVDGRYSLPDELVSGTEFDRDYRDNSLRGYVRYYLSDKTILFGSAGYLRRSYTGSAVGSFSGNVWSLSAQWQATEKTQLTLEASRNLQAYIDAQSDYYVSQGFSLAGEWNASEKVTLKTTVAWYNLDYIQSSGAVSAGALRHDKSEYAQLDLQYAPINRLSFDLGFHYEKRDSNQGLYTYDAKVVSASANLKFL